MSEQDKSACGGERHENPDGSKPDRRMRVTYRDIRTGPSTLGDGQGQNQRAGNTPTTGESISRRRIGQQGLEFPPLAGHFHSERVLSPTMGLRAGKESCWEGNDRGESSRMSSNETR